MEDNCLAFGIGEKRLCYIVTRANLNAKNQSKNKPNAFKYVVSIEHHWIYQQEATSN